MASSNKRGMLFLLALLGLFTSASVAVSVLMRNGAAAEKKQNDPIVVEKEVPVSMTDVLVPIQDIEVGTPVDEPMFASVSRPTVGLPLNLVKNFDDIRGTFARTFVPAYQPVVRNLFTKEQPANAVIASIPPGYRAVTINVDATTSVEGWANAGAIVDVHWISEAIGSRTVVLLVQNAKVLSAERRVDPKAQPDPAKPIPTTVTLLTTERDAQKISLAATSGTLVLHLRGAQDNGKTAASSGAMTIKDLVDGKAGENAGGNIEAIVRTRRPDGTLEEWAVIDGKLMARKG